MKYQPFEFSRQKYYYLEELLDELELKEETPEDILDAFCELAFLSRIGPLLGGDGELWSVSSETVIMEVCRPLLESSVIFKFCSISALLG